MTRTNWMDLLAWLVLALAGMYLLGHVLVWVLR